MAMEVGNYSGTNSEGNPFGEHARRRAESYGESLVNIASTPRELVYVAARSWVRRYVMILEQTIEKLFRAAHPRAGIKLRKAGQLPKCNIQESMQCSTDLIGNVAWEHAMQHMFEDAKRAKLALTPKLHGCHKSRTYMDAKRAKLA
jgi:hypothetical protein